jgi:hypothetical protein
MEIQRSLIKKEKKMTQKIYDTPIIHKLPVSWTGLDADVYPETEIYHPLGKYESLEDGFFRYRTSDGILLDIDICPSDFEFYYECELELEEL